MGLTLKNCPNFRDLGGYKKTSGGVTGFGKIYRSDLLTKLDETDAKTLSAHNINCVIDLRNAREIKEYPSLFAINKNFHYYNVSLTDGLIYKDFDPYIMEDMWRLYIGLVDEAADMVARVFSIMAQNADCGIVFHCTAGKDRTGVIAALLLMCAGVGEDDIISDYAMSYDLLKSYLEADKAMLKAKGLIYPDHVFRSDPENIMRFIEHLEAKYKTAEDYLKNAGVTNEEMAIIKGML